MRPKRPWTLPRLRIFYTEPRNCEIAAISAADSSPSAYKGELPVQTALRALKPEIPVASRNLAGFALLRPVLRSGKEHESGSQSQLKGEPSRGGIPPWPINMSGNR